MTPKVVSAEKGIGMTGREAMRFLSTSKSTMLLGTVDSKEEPNIHPTWFYFDGKSKRLYLFTASKSKKVSNVKRRPSVYFDVDDDSPPYKGVRGKAHAKILPKGARSVELTGKIIGRYLPLRDPLAKRLLSEVKNGEAVVIEVSPLYFSTWDYGKAQ